MLGLTPLTDLLERLESGRRRKLLELLAARPMSAAELRSHVWPGLTVGWDLRGLHTAGLVAYNRRANRYHLVELTLQGQMRRRKAQGAVGKELLATIPHPPSPIS